jgi:hypothetical protein
MSTGANSGAPDCSARCTEALATASFSFGTGVLAQAVSTTASAAHAAALGMNPDTGIRMVYLLVAAADSRRRGSQTTETPKWPLSDPWPKRTSQLPKHL